MSQKIYTEKNPIIKVSPPGINVITAKPDDCSIHSDFPIFKLYTPLTKKISQTFHWGQVGENAIIDIPHNYPFIPKAIVALGVNESSSPTPSDPTYFYYLPKQQTHGQDALYLYTVDATKLRISLTDMIVDRGAVTRYVRFDIRYYIIASNPS